MTLTDTGPIVALFDANDVHHNRCRVLLPSLRAPFITTWPCFTEAMYFIGRELGTEAQNDLWEWVEAGFLTFHEQNTSQRSRMKLLMKTYNDMPMDLADASLVTAAETLNLTQIFGIDSDFYVYRLKNGSTFDVLPGPLPR